MRHTMTIGANAIFSSPGQGRPCPEGPFTLQHLQIFEHGTDSLGDPDDVSIDFGNNRVMPIGWWRVGPPRIPAMEATRKLRSSRRAVLHGRLFDMIERVKIRGAGGANDQ